MAEDIFDKLRPRAARAPAAASVATEEDPLAQVQPQGRGVSPYAYAETLEYAPAAPTLRLAAPYRPGAFPQVAPQPWNQPVPTAEPGAPLQVTGEGQAAGAGPRTMLEPRSLVGDIARVPYAFARNAVTALPGMPADLGNLLGLGATKALSGVSQAFGGQPYEFQPVPLPGQEDLNKGINKALGVSDEPPPGLAGAPERIAGAIGSSVGPGAILGKIEPMVKLTGQTANVWNALKNFVTSGGVKSDVVIGAGSGIGMETVRQFFSDNPWLLAAGGALGGIVPAFLHGGFTKAAAPFQREQAVVAGEKGLQDVERLGEGITDSAARTVQAEKDRLAAEVLAAQQANKGTVAPLQADARAKQGLVTTAAEDLATAEAAAKAREVTATQQGEQWKTAARLADEREAARLAAQGTPPGAYAQLEPTLDLTNPPQGTLKAGETIRQDVAASGEATQQAQAQARMPEYTTATAGMGPDLPQQGLIDLTKGDFGPQFVTQKKFQGENLDEIEQIITKAARGTDRVPLDNTRNMLDRLVKEAQTTPGASVSPEILAYAEMGLSKAQKESLGDLTGLERARAALQLPAETTVPFSTLRKIDRELGAEGRAGLIGNMPQGEARALKAALNRDFDTFFRSDAGTGLGPEFAKRKESYLQFRTNFDESILGSLLDERAGYQAQDFITFLQSGNARDKPQLQFILDNASPETREAIKGHVVASLAQKSLDPANNLDPNLLGQNIATMRKNGTFDLHFDAQEQQTLVDTWQKLSAADTSIEPRFRDAVAKTNPEQVPALVFEPGNISYTQKYQKIATPQQYQESVGAWAADVKARLPDMKPEQIHKEFAPMAVKHDGVSQLDLMLGHLPGAADKISDMVTAHRTPPPTPGTPKKTLPDVEASAAWNLKQVQAQSTTHINEAKRLHTDALQEYKAAQQLAKDARAAGSQVTDETRERLTLAVREAERKQREAKAAVDLATTEAKEKLLAAKRDAAYKPSGAKRPAVEHVTQARALSAAALFGLLQAAVSHNPWVAGTSGAILGYQVGTAGKNAFFRSQAGQNFLRSYVPKQYGAKAATFAAQVLGQAAGAEEEPEPAPATTAP